MYGILITTGILIAALVGERLVVQKNKNTEIYWGGFIVAIISGLVGARLYHVLDLYEFYMGNPIQIIKVWQGGMGILGGILFGVLGILLYLKTKKEHVFSWLDIAGVVTPLAQGIGRWGNHFNAELLPYAYYESALNFGLFAVLLLVWKSKSHRLAEGSLFFLYVAGYSLIRIVLEDQRTISWVIGSVNMAVTLSIILVTFSLAFLIKLNFKKTGE
jgi:phosphatidylglycerol---prolipoprotein diacylglyceryl transferase